MFIITITTEIEDGPDTIYARNPKHVEGSAKPEEEQYYIYVPTGRTRKKTVEVYKQQLPTIDLQEIILAANQPHVINRSGKAAE